MGATGATGASGIAGTAGAPGATGVPGATGAQGVVWRGDYTGGVYNLGDAVFLGGSSYVALADGVLDAPPAADWNLIAAQGSPGIQGDPGVQGVPGPSGSVGPAGPTGPQGLTAGNRNLLINSNFDFWQRGVNATATGFTYLADRWYGWRTGLADQVQVQQAGALVAGSRYAARVSRPSGDTAVSPVSLTQDLETVNSVPSQGKFLTVSFYARAGADYSGDQSQLTVQIVGGSGNADPSVLDENTRNGFTGQTTLLSATIVLGSAMTQYVVTTDVPIPISVVQFGITFTETPGGTAGGNDYFDIAQVMLNEGTSQLAFQTAGGDAQGELARCERYYQFGENLEAATGYGNPNASILMPINFIVYMRIPPRIGYSFYNGGSAATDTGIRQVTNTVWELQVGGGATSDYADITWTADADL